MTREFSITLAEFLGTDNALPYGNATATITYRFASKMTERPVTASVVFDLRDASDADDFDAMYAAVVSDPRYWGLEVTHA